MKKIAYFFLVFLAVGSTSAIADQALAQSSGCMGCHQIDTKLVGPAFKDVAAKYAGDPSQVARLAKKVKAGSTPGEPLVWGEVAMPPNAASEGDIQKVVQWVMTLK